MVKTGLRTSEIAQQGASPLLLPERNSAVFFSGHNVFQPISLYGAPQGLNFIETIQEPPLCSGNMTLIKSKTIFADKVEAACRRYVAQLQENPIATSVFSQSQLLPRISSAAVNLIGSFSGLLTYIYGSVRVLPDILSAKHSMYGPDHVPFRIFISA
jgi:hypothetical protein